MIQITGETALRRKYRSRTCHQLSAMALMKTATASRAVQELSATWSGIGCLEVGQEELRDHRTRPLEEETQMECASQLDHIYQYPKKGKETMEARMCRPRLQ